MIKILIAQLSLLSIFSIEIGASVSNCDKFIVDERLPNTIASDMTLSSSKVYGIDKRVIVTNGAVLTIEPGTTLAGCSLFSYLVISQNSQIIAKGTMQKPITFTSQMELQGYSSKDGVGEWGGIVIAGNAYTHYEDNKYEADESISFGSAGHKYDNESSGALEHVVIKHTGYKVKKDKELNGLSLAGVGGSTRIKNIAIIGGKDDGLEIWGGKPNIDGLYVYNAMDDSVDVDLGYRGEISNVLVVQKKVDSKNNHDSSAMEFGNDENLIATNESNTTLPNIKNLTAYIEGGGLYNKFDAGFRLNNIKILSNKKRDNEMIYFRGEDSYTTGAKFLDGNVCLYNSEITQDLSKFFSQKNNKKPTDSRTAYDYFIKEHKELGKGRFSKSQECRGADETKIWKGKAGSFEPINQQ